MQRVKFFIGRNPMDRAMIVGQVMQHCKRLIDNVLEAADLQPVATASIALFNQMWEVARALLQAQVDLPAPQPHCQSPSPCRARAALQYVHTRTFEAPSLFSPIPIPFRPSRWRW